MMIMSAIPHKDPIPEIRLTLDARKRVSLVKLLPKQNISSFMAHMEGDKIILEPMAEIPARELWLHKNPKALKSVLKGIKDAKEGKVRKRGSFSKYANDEL